MDEGELSQVLKESFRLLGYQIGEACNVPKALHPLMDGGEAVVHMRLHQGRLRLSVYDEIDFVKAENQVLHTKVREKDAELKALNILLEKEREAKLKLEADAEKAEEPTVTVKMTIPKKPKRKKASKKEEVKTE